MSTMKTNNNGNKSRRPVKKKSKDIGSNKKVERASTNDPSWYAKDSKILNDVASMPFSWATGASYSLSNPFSSSAKYIPGICALYIRPLMGQSTDMSSPLNQASISHYSFVRHANSGHANYDAVDLTLYICAVSQVYSYINYLQRILKVLDLYSYKNYYYPDAILEAMGVNAKNIRTNYANFHAGINNLIMKAACLCAPTDMTLFNRQAMLYNDIYIGGSSIKDQVYFYTPVAFYQFGLDADGAGCLTQKLFYDGGSLKTYDWLLNFGYELITTITADEDMGIINGDIHRAYGDRIFKLATIGDLRGYTPKYDPLVLHQMLNATVAPVTGASCAVTQSKDKGYLICNPMIKYDQTNINYPISDAICEDRMLNVVNVEPTPEIILEISRLTVAAKNKSTSTDHMYSMAAGTEIVTACKLWTYVDDNGSPKLKSYAYSYLQGVEINPEHVAGDILSISDNMLELPAVWSKFKYAPQLNIITLDGGTYLNQYTLMDVDNYTILNFEDLDKMHHTALMHELYVPSVGWLV